MPLWDHPDPPKTEPGALVDTAERRQPTEKEVDLCRLAAVTKATRRSLVSDRSTPVAMRTSLGRKTIDRSDFGFSVDSRLDKIKQIEGTSS